MEENKSRAMIGNIPVWCTHDKIIDCAELIPNPKNPNMHPAKQIELLGKIITSQGWRGPITVSLRSGFIVKGHGRLEAALKAGILKAPVDFQNYENEAAEYADLVADNRLAELAQIDDDKMAELMAEINDMDIDIELTGFMEDELDDLLPKKEKETDISLAPKIFGDRRDTMPMKELLHSVDLLRVAFSGGKDSVGMVMYLLHHYEIPKNKIILEHFYNPLEWPDIPDYCKYFADTQGLKFFEYGSEPPDEEKEKIQIYGKRNADNFLIEKIKTNGLPSATLKWCMERYKQRPAWMISKRYNKQNINYLNVIGIRAAESPKRAKYLTRGITRGIIPFAHPIFDLSHKETFQLAIDNNVKLFHAYKFFDRTGCPFCPMSPAKDFAILRKEYPDVWFRALELFLLALENDFYRTTDLNRPKEDLTRYLGIITKKSRKKEWNPPEGLTFWRGDD